MAWYLFLMLNVFYFLGCHEIKTVGSLTKITHNTSETSRIKMGAGENHSYTVQLNPGEFLHVRIEQYDLDVIAKLTDANGQFAEIFDSPTSELGPEDIYLYSKEKQEYKIEIYPAQKYADQGFYQLRVARFDKATEEDVRWMTALSAVQKADKMRTKSETRVQSIEQYERSMKEWLVLKDTVQYARALRSRGFVNIRLRNYEKADEDFTQLIKIWNQLNDVRSAGYSYLVIGRSYDIQKNYSKSLEYNLASMPYWIKAGDTDQESFTLMNIGDLYSYLNDRQKMDEYFKQSLMKNEQSHRPSIKAVILRDYANSYIRVKDTANAILFYKQSADQWHKTANRPEEANTLILLGDFLAKISKQGEAIVYYQQALGILKKLNNEEGVKTVEALLAKLRN